MDSSNFQLDNEQSYVGLIDDIDAHSLLSCNEVEDIGTDNIEDYPTQVDNDVMRDNINDVLDVGVEEESNIIPHVGKMFRNESEAYSYYNAFARHKGFSIRKSTFRKKGDDVIWRVFVCSKEGYKAENDKRREGKEYKRRRVTREGCKARMKISRTKEDLWKVTFIDDEHNHPMLSTPSKVARLHSHVESNMNSMETNEITPIEAWSFQALWMDSCAKAIRDRELFDFAKGLLDSFEKKSASIEKARAVRDQTPQIGSNNVTNLPENIMIQDPRKCVGKGRPKIATRILFGIQTSQNTHTRSKCNKKGHDRRTCTENMILETSEELEGSENIL